MAKYKVWIATRDIEYAGTDSQVAIYFYGPNGGSGTPGHGWIELDNWGNDFQPGAHDLYEVDGNVNGPITTIELALNGTDDWQPEWVIVEDVTAGLSWRADFSDTPLSETIVAKPAILVTSPPPLPAPTKERERKLAEAWLQTYGTGIAKVARSAASSTALLAPILLQQLERCGFGARFVTIGGAFNAGIGYAGSIEGGGVFPVQRNRQLGAKVANYMTLSRGWDVSAGASAGAVVAAWNVASIGNLKGLAYSCHLSAQAGIGVAVSAIFSPDGNSPVGIQIAVLAGPDVSLGGGQMDPYTWIWPL
jgi:hypothetical protein